MDRHGVLLDKSHDLTDTHTRSHIPDRPIRTQPPPDSFPLSDLAVGAWGTVFHVGGELALRRRLLDMGLTPGTDILLRKVAPLGDPMELHLRGYELSLRVADARQILMMPRRRASP